MQRRGFIALASSAAAAGCLGGSSNGDDASNGNADTGDETESNTAETEDSKYPPGIDETGVVDPEALVLAHVTGFDMRSYEYSLTVEENGEAVLEYQYHVNAPADRALVSRTERTDGDATTTETYADGDGAYARTDDGNGLEYETVDDRTLIERIDVPNERAADHVPRLRYTLDGWDQITEQRTAQLGCRNNPQEIPEELDVADLEVTAVSEAGTDAGLTEVTDGRMLVDDEGRIREFSASVALEDDGEPLERTVRWEYSEVGQAKVTEPGWLEDAEV